MQRLLITIGILILVLGLLWPWVGKLPLGRLPGDILIEREGLRLYLPITTMLLISALVTLVLWFLRR
jgi:hypothetical protein